MIDDEDDNDITEDVADFPTLVQVGRFAKLLGQTKWFWYVGEDFDEELLTASRNYLDALGFPDVYPAQVEDWQEALASLETRDWNSPAWEAEEQLMAGLIDQALQIVDQEALEFALTHVTSQASEAITDNVLALTERWGIEDDDITRAVTGVAVQACYQAAMVIAAGGEADHPLALKYQVFETGFWPLGIMGNSYNIF